MMVFMENTIVLTDAERMELNQRAASRSGRADDARRARLMLLLETGHTWAAVRDKLDCNDAFIDRWSKRFREERLAGLFSRHAGQEASTLTPALEARILEWTLKRRPSDGATQWSTRRLGTQLKISHMRVSRVWAKHGLNPQRLDRYMATNDPDFEQKAADIIGLYLHPPAHAAVFCVDEKTAIQALDRKDPVLPLSPGRAERHGFEYFRHAVSVRGVRHQDRRGARQDGRATHVCGVRRVPGGHRCQPAARQRDSRDCRQPLGPLDRASRRLSGSTSEGSSALHSDLFLLAQPDRTLVCQDRARRHCARRVHVGVRLAEKAHEVHPALQQRAKDSKVALLRSYASHYSQFSCYSPLGSLRGFCFFGFVSGSPLCPSGITFSRACANSRQVLVLYRKRE